MARHEHEVRVEVLGPLRLLVDGAEVDVPGPKRRALLALLALAGRPLSVDELLGAVWPDDVPESGRKALHSHLSRLRGHLGPHGDRLARVEQTYRLDCDVDADEARRTGDVMLWRGTALEEFPDVAPLAAEAAALAELRLDLQDRWLEARVGTGDADLVADATRAVASAPLRERTAVVLVEALSAEGRQAEALRAAHDFRTRLAEATGLDPSPRFADVERVAAAEPVRTAAPRPSTPFIGREVEVALVHRQLAQSRMVTIVGAGGAGKTRLALEIAADVDAIVVHLADASVSDALATAFGVHAPTRDAVLAAAASTIAAPVVVVLDNCEHVLDESRDVAERLLRADPGVRVLATSREPIGAEGEHLVRLGPLPVPTEGTDPTGAPAYEAFLAHARRRAPDYAPTADDADAVAEVVRRLDGLPLAVELAAGRVGSLGIRDLADRLGRALDVLGSRPDRRHGTLRSAIDWSYQLLSDDERRLLCTVALLPAGFDLGTAEALGRAIGLRTDPAAALARLVDASVVVADLPRYRMLETIRAFAVEQLGEELDAAVTAVVAWAIALAESLDAALETEQEREVDRRFRAELGNLTRAVELADLDAQIALVGALEDVMTFRGVTELGVAAREIADRAAAADHPRRAVALAAAAQVAWLRGELDEADRLATEALGADPPLIARRRAYATQATVAMFRGDPKWARALYEEAASFPPPAPIYLITAAMAATYAGDREGAAALLARVEPVSPTVRAYSSYVRGELAIGTPGDAAIDAYTDAIERARSSGATFVEGIATVGLVAELGRRGQLHEALRGYRWLVDHWRRTAGWVQLWTTLRNLAGALADAGDSHSALFVLAAAEHAPEASLVDAATSREHAELAAHLEAAIGPFEAERVRTRAQSLPRGRVVDEVLVAVEQALAR